MDTLVTIDLGGSPEVPANQEMVGRAFAWFHAVEAACSRFDADSEVMRLTARIGTPQPVSALLFETVRFAVAMARMSAGAFDPTIGTLMEKRGFNRNYRTGARMASTISPVKGKGYRDIDLDDANRTITLNRPLVLDLGAVAKGLAIDLAARELEGIPNFAIDAGGDLLVRGRNDRGEPWRVAIRHPEQPTAHWGVIAVTDSAVCTSGSYARRGIGRGHHLVDPRSGESPDDPLSVTVVAPTAMLADGLSTAAFITGCADGLRLIGEHGAEGLLLPRASPPAMTRGFHRLIDGGSS